MPLFAQWACKGPRGEQKGKALSGATQGSVVANPSLSADYEAKRYREIDTFYLKKRRVSNESVGHPQCLLLLLYAAANKVAVAIAIVNLGDIGEELTLGRLLTMG